MTGLRWVLFKSQPGEHVQKREDKVEQKDKEEHSPQWYRGT